MAENTKKLLKISKSFLKIMKSFKNQIGKLTEIEKSFLNALSEWSYAHLLYLRLPLHSMVRNPCI